MLHHHDQVLPKAPLQTDVAHAVTKSGNGPKHLGKSSDLRVVVQDDGVVPQWRPDAQPPFRDGKGVGTRHHQRAIVRFVSKDMPVSKMGSLCLSSRAKSRCRLRVGQ